jgi:predicted ester cyclase
VHGTFSGTHRAAFLGGPASGRRATIHGIDIYTLRTGRIAAQRHCEDVAGLMARLTRP